MEDACVGIVLFNPNFDRFVQVMDAVTGQAKHVLLVDNGSDNLRQVESLASRYESVGLIPLGENRGIAAALNVICSCAESEGYDYVLTLDQDTVIEEGLICKLSAHTGEGIGIVCPRVSYEGNEAFQTQPAASTERIAWTITSGSLTSIRAWREVGGYDECMFIDYVDKDFCMRLAANGWSVLRVNGAVMHHQLGELHCKRVLGHTIYATNHSAWRRFYMARNQVYLQRKGLVTTQETMSWLIKESIKVTLFEHDRKSKTIAILRGAKEGLKMDVPSSTVLIGQQHVSNV